MWDIMIPSPPHNIGRQSWPMLRESVSAAGPGNNTLTVFMILILSPQLTKTETMFLPKRFKMVGRLSTSDKAT